MTEPKAAPAKGTVLTRLLGAATTPEERARAWAIATAYEQQRALQEAAAEVLASSWGNKVSTALRMQIIRWALMQGADPITEVDILGGKPYLNAGFYMRLVRSEPDFLRAEEEWLHDDLRATGEERERRRALRVAYAVPDDIPATLGLFRDQRAAAEGKPALAITAACRITLHFAKRGPFHGVKWSPSRATDDVGIDFPEAAARSRAWRKAAIQCVRGSTPFTERMRQLMLQQEVGTREEMPVTMPIAVDDPPIGPLSGSGT